jgi:hypothetical protein
LDSSRIVRLLCVPVLDGFSFSCYIHRPLPHERHWFSHQACYLPWRFSSNLVVKSGDEISFRG